MKIIGYIFMVLGFIGALVGFISFFTVNILPSNLETGELLTSSGIFILAGVNLKRENKK